MGYQQKHCFRIFLGIAILLALAGPATAEPVKLGAVFAITGKAKNSNKQAVLGVELAVREINLAGGVLGEPLELLLFDNESTPIGSHLAAEKAAEAGVAAIVGASWSSHSLAVARVAQDRKIPMVSPISTIPSLTAIGDHIFRVCYNDNVQGAVLAEFAARDLQAKSALILVDLASDFSLDISRIFTRNFAALGGAVVREIEYKTGQTDYLPQIRQALTADADVVFLSGYDESGLIASKLQQAGVRAIPLGSDGWDAESFYTGGGSKIRRGYYIDHWFATHADLPSRAFLEKYGKGRDLKAATALAYDAVNIIVAAIRRAKSSERAAIRANLSELRDFQGVTGDIAFDEQGDVSKHACIVEIHNGVPRLLKCRTPRHLK
jgi:branched-chain amino acid transport system substrate-binding protein